MEHTEKLVYAFILTLLAGIMLGYGFGAKDQYDEITDFLIAHAKLGTPFEMVDRHTDSYNFTIKSVLNNSMPGINISGVSK